MIEQFRQYLGKRCKIHWKNPRDFDEESEGTFFDVEKLDPEIKEMLDMACAGFAHRIANLEPFALLFDAADMEDVFEDSACDASMVVGAAMAMMADTLFLDRASGKVMISKRGELRKHVDGIDKLDVTVL